MEQYEQYTIFDKYIQKELTADEVVAFEQELSENEELREAFILYQKLHEMMSVQQDIEDKEGAVQQNIKRSSKVFFESYNDRSKDTGKTEVSHQSKVRNLNNNKRWLSIAAGLIGVLLAAYFLFTLFVPDDNKQYSNAELFAQYQSSFPPENFADKSGGKSYLIQAEQAYKQGNYEVTVQNLNHYISETQEDITDYRIYRCRGISQLHLNLYDAAIKDFELLKTQPTFKNEAHWYLALLYLKKGERNKTKAELDNIEKQSTLHRKADELKGKL